jgi:hypothetical protein
MRYAMKDWHFRTIDQGVVKDATLRVPEDRPVFYIELTR